MNKTRTIIVIILLLSTNNSISSSTVFVKSDLGPLIYSEDSEMVIYQGSYTTLTWIVVSKNPKSYYITNTHNGTNVLLQTSKPIFNSRIQIIPVGIPLGVNIITIYVSDYYNLVSSSSINITVLQTQTSSSPTTTFSSSSTSQESTKTSETTVASAYPLSVIFLGLIIISSFSLIRLKINKKKRREYEK